MRWPTLLALFCLTAFLTLPGCASRSSDSTADTPDAELPADATGRVLLVVTSHGKLGPSYARDAKDTGVWLEELAAPYYAFLDAGYVVEVATIQGGRPPIDPRSVTGRGLNETTRRFMLDREAQAAINNAIPVAEAKAERYDAIYLPGGHGTMWDFPRNPALQRLITMTLASDKPVGLVCHAPAALVGLNGLTGQPLVQGKTVNGFTNEEEEQVGLTEQVPFLLETELKNAGANFESGPAFEAFFVQDGNLFTGQNPASSGPMATAMIQALAE